MAFLFISMDVFSVNFKREAVQIPIKYKNFKLSGIVNIPSGFKENDPLVILVPSPQPHSKDSVSILNLLADSLAQHGIASFKYDNRALADSADLVFNRYQDRLDKFTMHDDAEDVAGILTALKADPRFSKAAIGLIGHSEGGCTSAIAASENKDVEFLIVLSSMGTTGELFAYNSVAKNLEQKIPPIFPSRQRNFLQHALFCIPYNIARYPDNKEAKKKIREDIIKLADDNSDNRTPFAGKLNIEEYADTLISQFISPRMYDMVRYDPKKYYSKIQAPVLITCATRDDFADYKTNMYAFERMFFELKKENYTMLKVDGADHAYKDQPDSYPYPGEFFHSRSYRYGRHGAKFGSALKFLNECIVLWIQNGFEFK